MLQTAAPKQSALQPPVGHWMLQFVLPVHVSVEPAPIDTLASAPPVTVTLLSGPVSSEQLLVPEHVETQSAAHDPLQLDWPAHVVVQPVPQVTLQVPLVSQLYVTLLAAVAASVAPAPPSPAPKVHVPFCAHPQTLPSQTQSPVQDACPLASGGGGGGGVVDVGAGVVDVAVAVAVAVGVGGAASDASGVSTIGLSSVEPHPIATAMPTRETEPNSTAKRVFVIGTPRADGAEIGDPISSGDRDDQPVRAATGHSMAQTAATTRRAREAVALRIAARPEV
jgi:hypothetical protein